MFDWLRKAFGGSAPKHEKNESPREFIPVRLPSKRQPQSEHEKVVKLRMECEGKLSNEEYRAEFRPLTDELYAKFAVEDTPYDLLLEAMSAVENEMNRNGGVNWNTGGYDEYLDHVREQLTTSSHFNANQVEQISWSVNEIAACGRELKEEGESSRLIQSAIDYLVARVVDWCEAHPPLPNQDRLRIRN